MACSLPSDPGRRGDYPMADGLLDYFPNSLAEVARLSKFANAQHNPGEPMHWARDKSTDHANKIVKHLIDRGKFDTDGMRHSAKVAWRALALLQEEIERDDGAPMPRNARIDLPPPNYDPDSVAFSAQGRLAELAQESQSWGMYAHADTPAKTAITDLTPKWSPQWLAEQGVPAESTYIARFSPDGSRIATADEVAGLRESLAAEQLREYGIGDVPATLRGIPDSFTDSRGNRITRHDVTRHPMHAEALRDEYEKTNEGTGL